MSGHLEEGRWVRDAFAAHSASGDFVRREAQFRRRVTAGGEGGFRAERGRYHLYVSLACPWAHRAVIYRVLKGLESTISLAIVDPVIRDDSWELPAGADSANGFRFLREAYLAADPRYSGRVTVPVLWDRERHTIVSNESAEIIRMLNAEFDAFAERKDDFYPAPLRAEIDALNDRIYGAVNNGVYRCGFAATQAAYGRAFDALFACLDELERRLGERRFLTGDAVTEADWRLFTTLVRFDAVYYVHFKCNLRRIADYPGLSRLLAELYRVPGVAGTVNMDHIKRHYYLSHRHLNPSGIVPKGPEPRPLG